MVGNKGVVFAGFEMEIIDFDSCENCAIEFRENSRKFKKTFSQK